MRLIAVKLFSFKIEQRHGQQDNRNDDVGDPWDRGETRNAWKRRAANGRNPLEDSHEPAS